MHFSSRSAKAKSFHSCGSGSSTATLVFAIKHKLLTSLLLTSLLLSSLLLLLSVMFIVSVVAFFQPNIVGPTVADVPAIARFLAVTGNSAVASVPAVAAVNAVVGVLTGADVPTVLLLTFIAFDCFLAVVCVSAVANIPVLLAVLGIRIRIRRIRMFLGHPDQLVRLTQCCGSMTFWCGSGSGSADPFL
jgi:hypothetical protein